VEKRGSAVYAFLVLGPPLIGAYPITGLINPFWGSLFGFPLYAAAAGHAVYDPHPWTEAAAFLLWPLVMLVAMAWLAYRLVSWKSPWRAPLILLWSISAFCAVPTDFLWNWFAGWPIYGPFE
jgi:hypothetical protein